MKEEILAMRPRWVLAVHIFAIATMAAFLSAAAYLSFRPGGWLSESKVFWAVDAVIFALGMILLVFSVREIVRYCRVPRIIAVRRDGEIEFLGEKFSLSEIAEVSCRRPCRPNRFCAGSSPRTQIRICRQWRGDQFIRRKQWLIFR